MNLPDSLRPDVEKATSKVTITITGCYMNDDREQAFVGTNWHIEGIALTLHDLINVIEGGKNDIINQHFKVDQN